MARVEKILILDFGSQYTHLIARRIREMGVYSEIVPSDTPFEHLLSGAPKGIILSGGPGSTSHSHLRCDPRLLHANIPLLGICYGMQLMNVLNEGTVVKDVHGEYGKQKVHIKQTSPIFRHMNEEETVWMSHGDSIQNVASCYHTIAKSKSGVVAAIEHRSLPHFGVQFHPEVTHTENGFILLENFLSISGCSRNWSVSDYLESAIGEIRKKVGQGRVVSLVSGGVDSTAATFLCLKALGPQKVFPLHVDSGLMREGESREVKELLVRHGMEKLIVVDSAKNFLAALKGVTDPEQKRKIIGELFIAIFEEEITKLDRFEGETFLCQGTLYTDLIESGKGCGKHADVIKTHHNVGPPIVEKKRNQGLILEPNAPLFKDEVKKVCAALKIPEELINRHPFPGPGLAIRIMGEVTEEPLKTLRQADKIFIHEIRNAGLYPSIWQAFAVLIPVSTVGVMGDKRTTGHVIALRAVSSVEGMTADFSPVPLEILGRVATRITNEVPGINRVVYDITSKPPGTIEWE
jgi:GMP synthase (glutamine-hydrolysing)